MINVDVSKTGVQNLLDLIELNNPDLPIPLTESNVMLRSVDSTVTELTYSIEKRITQLQYIEQLGLWVGCETGNIFAVSTDRVEWSYITLPISYIAFIYYSTYHSKIAVLGVNGDYATSPDGVNWTSHFTGFTDNLYAVADSTLTGKIVTGGGNGSIYTATSFDGPWTTVSTGTAGVTTHAIYLEGDGTTDLFCITPGGSNFAIFNGADNTVGPIQSTGSITGTSIKSISRLAYSPSLRRLMAVTSNELFTSDNAWNSTTPTWTFQVPVDQFSAIHYKNGLFVRNGSLTSKGISTSTDGVTWVNYPIYDQDVGLVHWVASESTWFLDSTVNLSFQGTDLNNLTFSVYTSTQTNAGAGSIFLDPKTNKIVLLNNTSVIVTKDVQGNYEGIVTNTGDLRSIAYSPALDRYIASDATNSIWYSSDLTNWTRSNGDQSFYQAIWVEQYGKFYATHFGATSALNGIITSEDGINWVMSHQVNGPFSITWSPELNMILVGAIAADNSQNEFIRSTDGVNWTNAPNTLANRRLDWSPKLGMFIASSSGPSYRYSYDGINWTTIGLTGNSQIQWMDELGLWVAFGNGLSPNNLRVSKDGINWTNHSFITISTSARPVGMVWNPITKVVESYSGVGLVPFNPITANQSSVLLTAVQDSGYSGSLSVNYYRPSLIDLNGAQETVPTILLDTTLYDSENTTAYEADSLTRIATALGIRESDLWILGTIPVPMNESDERTLRVKVKYNSYLYSGGDYEIRVAAIDTDTPLETVITEPNMSGFTL